MGREAFVLLRPGDRAGSLRAARLARVRGQARQSVNSHLTGTPSGLLLKRDGVCKGDGWEAGAERDARLWGLPIQSTPRCPVQRPIVAPETGTAVGRVMGFAQPVVEGRGGELQFPAGNAEPWLFAFLISRCLDCSSPCFRGQGCNYTRGTFLYVAENTSELFLP